MADLFTLAESAVVQAGAGTGKTHSLITLCLHLLGGAGRAEPLQPSRLWAVTFTEKAAAELSSRLRQRVDRLAELAPGGALHSAEALAAAEPELVATCAGRGVPDAALWRKTRRDLGLAQIGTIHSLCSQILRRHAPAAGLDPGFTLLDELESQALSREACEAAVLDALEGSALEAPAQRVCEEMGFAASHRFSRGLADELQSLLRALGESGRNPVALVDSTAGLSEARALGEDLRARNGLLAAFDALESCAQPNGKRSSNAAAQALALCADFRVRVFPAISRLGAGELRQAAPLLRSLEGRLYGFRASQLIADAHKGAKEALTALLEADAQVRASGLSRDLALLAEEAQARYRARKARLSALDFDDLTRLARDLLARDAGVRRAEKARIGALLVDEFQDTSRAQLELFGWLSEGADAEGTAPAGSGLPGALPVARGLLVAVGDRKQSIYEFRGADVASAQAFAARALDDGAQLHLLRESRRSRPALVSFANVLFSRALAPPVPASPRPFDTPFRAGEDDLVAHRPPGPPGPCAELIDVDGSVEDEAEAVARRIAQLLAPAAAERVYERDGERPRPVRGGDIAVLLRMFTHVEAFRRALLARRIPHLVLKGRSFREAREVVDLVSLLSLALDPDDALALSAVLRSPLGPVSDEGLVLLSRGPRRGADGSAQTARKLDRRALTDPLARAALAPDDAASVARIARIVTQLAREADRLGPAALLEAALAESDYVAAAAGGLFGEQAAANLDKLVALARAHELRGGTLRGFLARMQALEDGDGAEPDAPVVEERDPHAVRILTIHAAKGLEFPIVFVPECAQPPRSFTDAVIVDADLGFALKARAADGRKRWGSHGDELRRRKLAREEAQGRRLLYVAATRARDLVVFSARASRSGGGTWRELLWDAAARPEAAGLARLIPAATLTNAPVGGQRAALSSLDELVFAAPASPAEAALRAEARASIARATAGAPRAQGTLIAPVTQLADAAACPERYRLLHEVGLEERPGSREQPAPLRDPDDEGGRPAAERGTLAHRLLELAPLDLPDAPSRRAALRALLASEGEDPDAQAPVLEACVEFLGSPLAQRMGAAQSQRLRLQREHPFALQLAPGPGDEPGPALVLRGQLDALLLDGGEATVIDYKHAEKRDVRRYDAQLDAYALAANSLLGGAVPVKTGLVFLRTRGAPFVERAAATDADHARTRTSLLGAARAVAAGRQSGAWSKVAQERCRELGCGFLPRCHRGELPG